MNKKHFLYLLFEIKSTLRMLPKIILCSLFFAGIVVILGFCGNKILTKPSQGAIHFDVAVVLPKDDNDVELCYNLLVSMESVKSTCNFLRTEHDEAMEMLKSGKVVAVFELPKNFVRDLMYGENTPATITIPDNAGMESLFFCSMIDAGANTLANSESGIYAVSDLLEDYGIDPENAQNDLFSHYLKYTLNRGTFFKEETVSVSGVTSIVSFYISTGIVLMLILCMMAVTNVFSIKNKSVTEAQKTLNISGLYTKFCEYIGVVIVFFLLFSVIYTVAACVFPDIFVLSAAAYCAIFIVCASITGFVMFLCCIGDSGLISTMCIFLVGAFIMYACGRIIPSAYIPDGIYSLGKHLPATYWCNLTDTIFTGHINPASLLWTIVYAVSFYILSIITLFTRRCFK